MPSPWPMLYCTCPGFSSGGICFSGHQTSRPQRHVVMEMAEGESIAGVVYPENASAQHQ